VSEQDLCEPWLEAQLEEPMNERTPQVEVNEGDGLTRTRHRHSQIGRRCRLTLALDGARDHDRLDVAPELCELDVRAKHAEGLRSGTGAILHHHEPIVLAQAAAWLGQTRQ